MLTLSRTGRFGTLGDTSPFILRVETWLRMADISYESKLGSVKDLLAESPSGLVPFADLDGEVIADSSVIIERLKALHNDPLNDGRLNESEQALGTLIKSVCEHELLEILVYGRWLDGEMKTLATFFLKGVPEEILPKAIERTKQNIVNGILYRLSRYEPEFVRTALRAKLDVLSHFLGDKPFLFGSEPSTFDAGLYGILAAFIDFPLPDPQVQIAREYGSLVDYCDRIKQDFHYEDDWVHGA